MTKIKLERSPYADIPGFASRSKSISLMLPYFLSTSGKYTHRVRYASSHWRDGKLSHIAVNFWCGRGGFLGAKGKLFKEVQEGQVLCATCEGRAVGAGVDGARLINGREVMYSPKEIK